jgi:hypothetical protein
MMFGARRWYGWSLVGLGLLACADDQGERHSFANTGTLCLGLKSDGKLALSVAFPVCLSSSCDQVVDEGCDVVATGDTLSVTSHAAYQSDSSTDCTNDCKALVADCESAETIPPGNYKLQYGGQEQPIVLGTTRSCWFGSP